MTTPMREQLREIMVQLDQAERSPAMFVAQPGRLFGLVRRVGGLLEAIVAQLERSSTDGKPEGIARHV